MSNERIEDLERIVEILSNNLEIEKHNKVHLEISKIRLDRALSHLKESDRSIIESAISSYRIYVEAVGRDEGFHNATHPEPPKGPHRPLSRFSSKDKKFFRALAIGGLSLLPILIAACQPKPKTLSQRISKAVSELLG